MDIEIRDIQTFVTVADVGSVNRATAILRLSQPAVTRRLQRFEAALGVTLLDRRARPPTLTPLGKMVLEQCRHILKTIETLEVIVAPDGEPRGEFRLGMVHSLAELALAETADHLRRLFPRLTLRLTTAWSQPLLEQVRVGALDAAIVYLPEGAQPASHTDSQRIASVPLVFVAPPERRMPRIIELAEVVEERWVLNPDGCIFRSMVTRMLDRFGAPLRVAVEAHGVDLQLDLVARGAGLSLIPQPIVHRRHVQPQVHPFRIRDHDCRLEVWMVSERLPIVLTGVLTAQHEQLGRLVDPG